MATETRKRRRIGGVPLAEVVSYLDTMLEAATTPDYPQAVNGLQLANRGRVHKAAAAVDFSSAAIESALAASADLLLVHHGMFWGGPRPFRDTRYDQLRSLIQGNVAVYSSHLPLDRHAELGNAVLLARELGLTPTAEFARYESIAVGVRGESDVATSDLLKRARTFARRHGGDARGSPIPADHRTKKWGICTGAGAGAETLAEAGEFGLDTLIVGEGPHWTAVAAGDARRAIIYAGHYATETLGVSALAQHLAERFEMDWVFLEHPTGL
jgi:dinuclear metal center YbgI/SA1388 family protein